MSGIYTVSRDSAALSTTADLVTVVAAAGKPLRVHMIDLAGKGAAAADNTVLVSRSTGGTTPGSAITPQPTGGAGAASFAVYRTWAAQPTLAADPLWRATVNALNGKDRFVATPGAEIEVPAGAQLSVRSASGTSNVAINLLVEEIG